VTRLAKEGWEVSFARDTGIIKKENQESYLERIGGLYKLANQQALYTEIEWHERYGHLPFSAFRYIPEASQHLRTSKIQCARCIKAKMTKPISHSYGIRTSRVGELLHANLCGLLPVQDLYQKRYMLVLVDDYSRFIMTRAIREKADAAEALQEMIPTFEKLTNCQVGGLRTDWGGEFNSHSFLKWLSNRGTKIHPTVPYHSETNTVAERANRTIMTMIRANLDILPKSLWSYAMDYSAFVKNRLPSLVLNGKSPIEIAIPERNILKERNRFRPFGQPVFIHTYQDGKLVDRATKARILGFIPTFGVYKVILVSSHRVTTAKNPVPIQLNTPTLPINMEQQALEPAVQSGSATLTTEQISEPLAISPAPQSQIAPTMPEPEASTEIDIEKEANRQLLSESQKTASRRSTRATAGKAPLRLSDDPAYLRTQSSSHTPDETHLTMTEALKTS